MIHPKVKAKDSVSGLVVMYMHITRHSQFSLGGFNDVNRFRWDSIVVQDVTECQEKPAMKVVNFLLKIDKYRIQRAQRLCNVIFLFVLFSEFYLYIVLPDKIILIINNPQETREINIVFKNLEKIVSLFFQQIFYSKNIK